MTTKLHRKTTSRLILITLIFAYVVTLVTLTVLDHLGADLSWIGALNLYLPQVVWALPGILLTAFAVKVAWCWIWLPLLCLVWVAGPLMGFCWPLHSHREMTGNLQLRVMTWNVKYGSHDKLTPLALMYDIDWNNPDIVLLQDAGGVLSGPLGAYFSKWKIVSFGQYIIASRLPLGEPQVRRIPFSGEEHTCVRTEVLLGSTRVALYNIHFHTPREGLNALRVTKRNPRGLPKAIQQLENNMEARLTQAQTLREYVRLEHGPVIIAGDLNSPDSSSVCETLRSAGLHDAFAEGGKGYGYTYGHFLLQHRFPSFNASWMRIDHLMLSSQFKSRRCWTGTDKASDHRPVIADLVLEHSDTAH